MVKILIVGSTGHIGSLLRETFKKVPALDVWGTSRRKDLVLEKNIFLDLTQENSFENAANFEYIINCTDTYSLKPDGLIRFCLQKQSTFIEISAETDVYLRIEQIVSDLKNKDLLKGSVICGVGVFPGLSNVVAAHAMELTKAKNADLFLNWSIFSEAGAGTCEVMVQALGRPAIYLKDGEVVQGSPIPSILSHSLFGNSKYGLQLGLAEPFLLNRSRGAKNCKVFASIQPELPKTILGLVAFLARKNFFKVPLVQALLRKCFVGVRAYLLKKKITPIEILAKSESAQVRVTAKDAIRLAAEFTAILILHLDRSKIFRPGMRYPDEILSFKTLDEEWRKMNFQKLDIKITGS